MQSNRVTRWLNSLSEKKLLSATLVLFTLSIGIVIGTLISSGAGAAKKEAAAPDATPLKIPEAKPLENEFTKIARKTRPTVVSVVVEVLQSERGGRRDQMEEFFRRFFGMPDVPGPDRRERRPPGQGSGVIVDPNGYIITNHHVVDGADRIRVQLFDDEQLYDAKLIGQDVETDLAVIRIDPDGKELHAAGIGNSDAVSVGDWAIAAGSPFGFRESITVGIISAKAREVQGPGPPRSFQKFLQTDAAINPGNSGGPLVNIRGELIGINTAIVTRTGAYNGLGFALASNIAVDVYNQIIQHGRVTRGSIGITFQSGQDPALLRAYGAEKGGVVVSDVRPDGPAAEAGMQPDDVIVEIDGEPVRDGEELISTVASKTVGETVDIKVIRDGEEKTLQVEIADRAELFGEELGITEGPSEDEAQASEVLFGITVSNLSDAEKAQIGFEEEEGVLVNEVEPASFADDIGLRANDVIVSINRQPTYTVGDVREIQQSLKPGDDVAFKVMRRLPRPGQRGQWVVQYLAGVLPEEGGAEQSEEEAPERF